MTPRDVEQGCEGMSPLSRDDFKPRGVPWAGATRLLGGSSARWPIAGRTEARRDRDGATWGVVVAQTRPGTDVPLAHGEEERPEPRNLRTHLGSGSGSRERWPKTPRNRANFRRSLANSRRDRGGEDYLAEEGVWGEPVSGPGIPDLRGT